MSTIILPRPPKGGDPAETTETVESRRVGLEDIHEELHLLRKTVEKLLLHITEITELDFEDIDNDT